MDIFNTREIATVIWLLIAAGWALTLPGVRSAFASVVLAAFRWKLIGIAALLAGYTAGMVALLHAVGFWTSDLLKDTVLWFAFTGIVTGFSATSLDGSEPIARRILRDSIKVVILLEFLSNTYTFSLLAELVLVPVLFFIVTLNAVAEAQMPGTKVASFARGLTGVAGFALVVGIVHQAVGTPGAIAEADPIHSILLAPVLSLALIPCAVGVFLLSAYDMLFARLRMGREKSKDVVRYARWRLITKLGLRPRRVREFLNTNALGLMRIESRADVDSLLGTEDDTEAR